MVLLERTCPTCGAASLASTVVCEACGTSLKATRPLTGEPGDLPPTLQLTQHIQASQLFKGRYRIVRQVGVGGFGAVYEAEDTRAKRRVAIKEIGLTGLTPQQVIEATDSFNREVELLSKLKHSSIPRMYEHLTDAEHWYLVMDFIAGETLEEHLAEASDGRVPLKDALYLGVQLCDVLDYLHTRQPAVIFRDLKPANIMLTSKQKLCLIDFGVARRYKPGQLKDTIAFGSPGYAAPEQYGRAQTTPRSDIYSLGALLHQMLSGRDPSLSPFRFQPLRASSPALPTQLEKLVAQMLELDRDHRPASVKEVRGKLQSILALPKAVSKPRTKTPLISDKHPNWVTAVAWSPRGTQIASACYTSTAYVWDAQDGRNLSTYRHHSGRVLRVAWSPAGTQIASLGRERTIHIWDPLTGKFANFYREHQARVPTLGSPSGDQPSVGTLAWSPDGKWIASACEEKTIQIWETMTSHLLDNSWEHGARVLALSWSPDGKRIASGGEDNLVQVWNVPREKPGFFSALFAPTHGRLTYRGHVGQVNGLAWSPDGERIASVSSDKTLQVWDAVNGEKCFLRRSPSSLTCIAWSSDGCYLATGDFDNLVQVWDAATGDAVATYAGHSGFITSVSWSPDGKQLVSASFDHTIRIWHLP